MFEARQLTEYGKIYLDAANLLEQKGWCQKKASSSNGNVCLAEAILRATFNAPDGDYISDSRVWMPITNRLANYIGVLSIVDWNDTTGRTKTEIIEKLREAAYNPI